MVKYICYLDLTFVTRTGLPVYVVDNFYIVLTNVLIKWGIEMLNNRICVVFILYLRLRDVVTTHSTRFKNRKGGVGLRLKLSKLSLV